MKHPVVASRRVVVTGCSSGIGWSTAECLRARGWTVAPTARKPEDLERLRVAGFEPLALDLADSDSVQGAIREILARWDGQLGGLVNNAGFGQPGAVEDLSRAALRQQFEVNVFGLQELTNGLLPSLRAQGAGRIVNISSILGLVVTPFIGAYCASKYALEALSDALRIELRGTGVAVSLIEPGPILSAFRQRAVAEGAGLEQSPSRFAPAYAAEFTRRARKAQRRKWPTLGPEAVATAVAEALESPRPFRRRRITCPARLGARLIPFLPTAALDALLARRLPPPQPPEGHAAP
ncbi:MAG: SDR family NAD(P)-dependent oxidoreductase [Candidatus Marinimicrobia bacterium]|nr:SDR family NAD(P)-dependent oxidoreductase [Candidatus Neomarinimicrobiota bacterium]